MTAELMDMRGILDRVRKSDDKIEKSGVWLMAAARTPSGRLFPPVAEAAVHALLPDLARESITKLSRAKGRVIVAVEDFAAPTGAPDLLCVSMDPNALAKRKSSGVPPLLNQLDAAIVSRLSPRYRGSVDDLATGLRQPTATVERRLRELMRVGAVTGGPESLIRADGLVPVADLWAFEAKVSDWRRGFQQAGRYAHWADYTVLVLPAQPRNTEDAALRAARLEIGVFAGGRWLSRPRRAVHDAGTRLWASEHFVAAAG